MKEEIPAAAEVELTNKPDWGGCETPLIAEFNLKIPGWASGAGKHAVISVGLFTAAEKRIFENENRIYPVYFEYPFEKLDDVSIELPLGWQVASLPPAQSQDGHIVSYTLKTENNKGTLHVARMLNVDFLLLETKYYGALRKFFQIVRTGDEKQIMLQPASAAARN